MQLDEFEARFKRADKRLFEYREIQYKRIFVITDMIASGPEEFVKKLQGRFHAIAEDAEWGSLSQDDFTNAKTLLAKIDEFGPDLIITYRNLRYEDKSQPYTLGIYVDVLTQATLLPILMVPTMETDGFEEKLSKTHHVLVVTDNIEGDEHLIDSALPFAGADGALTLAHIEDKRVFDRYMQEIEKVPSIPTDKAREAISETLLKEAEDYIKSATTVLTEKLPELTVRSHVKLGCCLEECRSLVADQDIGLVVANTKDTNQLAMHGDAYAIAVELRDVPLLLL